MNPLAKDRATVSSYSPINLKKKEKIKGLHKVLLKTQGFAFCFIRLVRKWSARGRALPHF